MVGHSIIPAFLRLRQDCEFVATLGYIALKHKKRKRNLGSWRKGSTLAAPLEDRSIGTQHQRQVAHSHPQLPIWGARHCLLASVATAQMWGTHTVTHIHIKDQNTETPNKQMKVKGELE